MTGVTTKVVMDQAQVEALLGDPGTDAAVHAVANDLAARARGFAARRTGAGAASIAARPGRRRRGTWVVSWDRAHRYMIFPEGGTRFMEAHPALQPALDTYAQF